MASTTTIDDLTAGAIRQALSAAAAGRLADACAVGERALAQGGDVAALNAMLGMLRGRSGDHERAVNHLRVAHASRPLDPVIANNLASELVQSGNAEEVLEFVSDALIDADKTGNLLKLRGFAAQESQKFDVAIADYEKATAADPNDCESWNNLGNARRSAGDIAGAITALRRAVELDRNSAPIRLNYATALVLAGDWDVAEPELRKMAADFPDDPNPWRELHAMFKWEGRDQDALEAIREALARAPEDISLLLGMAGHLSYMVNSAGSEEYYRRVLALDERNALANLGLAVCFDLTNRLDELSQCIKHAESIGVGSNALNFMRALDHRRAKRFEEGIEALSEVPDNFDDARRAHLMGQLLEGVGRYDEAFENFTLMNELMSKDSAPPEARAAAYRNMLRDRHALITKDWADRWRTEQNVDPRPAPTFLIGFPRSGTTLLDTILMSHPSIEVLEEEPTLHRAFETFADYEDLPTASDEVIQKARDAYFQAAAALTPLKPGNMLVDKNPLAMNGLPFIRRLFPDAKIILALRHPCDVVLSCYVTNFKLNDGMANFVRLDTAADLYDVSFSYLERCQEIIPMNMNTVVYENVVADRDRELRALFDFLELDWHDAVLDHQATALSRGRIKTASYAQVVEPIYNRSAGRWQNYRKHLEPVFPILRPWVEKFGYEL
jgi:tetratricopeptide (TPR) repeat protein